MLTDGVNDYSPMMSFNEALVIALEEDFVIAHKITFKFKMALSDRVLDCTGLHIFLWNDKLSLLLELENFGERLNKGNLMGCLNKNAIWEQAAGDPLVYDRLYYAAMQGCSHGGWYGDFACHVEQHGIGLRKKLRQLAGFTQYRWTAQPFFGNCYHHGESYDDDGLHRGQTVFEQQHYNTQYPSPELFDRTEAAQRHIWYLPEEIKARMTPFEHAIFRVDLFGGYKWGCRRCSHYTKNLDEYYVKVHGGKWPTTT